MLKNIKIRFGLLFDLLGTMESIFELVLLFGIDVLTSMSILMGAGVIPVRLDPPTTMLPQVLFIICCDIAAKCIIYKYTSQSLLRTIFPLIAVGIEIKNTFKPVIFYTYKMAKPLKLRDYVIKHLSSTEMQKLFEQTYYYNNSVKTIANSDSILDALEGTKKARDREAEILKTTLEALSNQYLQSVEAEERLAESPKLSSQKDRVEQGLTALDMLHEDLPKKP